MKTFFKNRYGKVSVAVAPLLVAAGSASATVADDITAAFTAAEANVTLAAGGVIGVVAIMTGIGFIIGLLRK
jgi:hypothetical protein